MPWGWRREKPTEPGVYFFRPEKRPYDSLVVRVSASPDGLRCSSKVYGFDYPLDAIDPGMWHTGPPFGPGGA